MTVGEVLIHRVTVLLLIVIRFIHTPEHAIISLSPLNNGTKQTRALFSHGLIPLILPKIPNSLELEVESAL